MEYPENTENLNNAEKMSNTEMIGKVTLDLSAYPGEDKYCDGDIEDRLLEIARDRSKVEYASIIEESANWPVLYHLSYLRENIVEWLPINNSDKVLEIGAGCGAITGVLSEKAKSVSCVDLSLKRSRINAYRNMERDNVTIHVGNFTDVEKTLDTDYKYILLIGVFEYARSYIGSSDPYGDFLKLIRAHLAPDGIIAIAIENRFGLKYWAGCAEDHIGTYFTSLEGYPDGGVVRTFTDRELIRIVEKAGFGKHKMYYPYPDYKFMTNLYSDSRLPRRGELKDNIRNMDRDRYLLFNEKNVFDSIIDDGLFDLYSNSYMLLLGLDESEMPEIDYVRYSNDRKPEYRICTEIIEISKIKYVLKRALDPLAKEHIRQYVDANEKLKKRYEGSGLSINNIIRDYGDAIVLEYLEGVTLEEKLDALLAQNDNEGFLKLFEEYLKRISYGEEDAEITDIDLIFSNIIISGDTWTVIDHEWITTEKWSAKELGFRAIYCYLLEDEKRDILNLDSILKLLDVNEETAQYLREREMKFQKRVTGNHKALGEIRELIGNEIRSLDGSPKAADVSPVIPQIYLDTGLGFNEAESFFAEGFPFSVGIPAGVRAVRIDPCNDFCLVRIENIKLNGEKIKTATRKFVFNGKKIGEDIYAFATSDPGFTIKFPKPTGSGENLLEADMTVTVVDPDTAGRIG